MCPNDDAPMQTLERSGVQFDMCPKCRGVWLDRGELEKLMEAAMDEGRASAPAAHAPPPQPGYAPPPQAQPWGGGAYRDDDRRYKDERYRDDRDHRHGDDHRYGYKKKKRDSIFDIFD
jgi:Zn-finger nucleic acid-binding protein